MKKINANKGIFEEKKKLKIPINLFFAEPIIKLLQYIKF